MNRRKIIGVFLKGCMKGRGWGEWRSSENDVSVSPLGCIPPAINARPFIRPRSPLPLSLSLLISYFRILKVHKLSHAWMPLGCQMASSYPCQVLPLSFPSSFGHLVTLRDILCMDAMWRPLARAEHPSLLPHHCLFLGNLTHRFKAWAPSG